MKITFRQSLPTLLLLALFILVGFGLHILGTEIFWSGYIAMMLFYALIFLFGTYAANLRNSETDTDVMLAGRNIPLFIAVFTMSATWVGGGYINGSAEATYKSGLAWVQAPWGYALSLVIGGLFFARKMRRFEFKTMLDPLSQRFGKKMAALLFLPALMGEIFWTAAILTALGTTFGTVLGLDFNTSIIFSALIAIAYTAIGGLWAVALTDVLQLFLLMFGLLLVLPFALEQTGGLSETLAQYESLKGSLSFFPPWQAWNEKLYPDWGNYFWNWLDYALLLTFGGIPWQVYFQRVLSAKDEKTAMYLSFFAAFVCILAAIPAILMGMIGAVTDWQSLGLPALTDENAAFTLPYVIRYLTNPFVATIGLGAVAAAVMSSVDSSILSASSMASWNVYRPLFQPNVSSENLAKVLKKCIWIIGIAATLLAIQVKSVYDLWYLCSDFVYVILFPQLVTALFDKKANKYGAMAGFAVAFVLRFGGGEPTLGIPQILPYPMVTDGVVLFPFRTLAMISSLTTIIVFSRLTQKSCPPTILEKEVPKE